jgi:Xaa-Pro aminopeptidase
VISFFGSNGDAVVTMDSAYLFVDARYWIDAKAALDRNWRVVRAGDVNQPKDWMEWIVVCILSIVWNAGANATVVAS